MDHASARKLAQAVLDGKPRSYVEAARELASHVLAQAALDLTPPACTCNGKTLCEMHGRQIETILEELDELA